MLGKTKCGRPHPLAISVFQAAPIGDDDLRRPKNSIKPFRLNSFKMSVVVSRVLPMTLASSWWVSLARSRLARCGCPGCPRVQPQQQLGEPLWHFQKNQIRHLVLGTICRTLG